MLSVSIAVSTVPNVSVAFELKLYSPSIVGVQIYVQDVVPVVRNSAPLIVSVTLSTVAALDAVPVTV